MNIILYRCAHIRCSRGRMFLRQLTPEPLGPPTRARLVVEQQRLYYYYTLSCDVRRHRQTTINQE